MAIRDRGPGIGVGPLRVLPFARIGPDGHSICFGDLVDVDLDKWSTGIGPRDATTGGDEGNKSPWPGSTLSDEANFKNNRYSRK